jgi:hypothetical protein
MRLGIARQWSNRLGWSIATPEGDAEVFDIVRALKVIVPMAPAKEWCESPISGPARFVYRNRERVCLVPLGTDPIEAVRRCLAGGVVQIEYVSGPNVPMIEGEPIAA